jgi:uncharacterized protein
MTYLGMSGAESVNFCWGLKVPLRDQVHLNATAYIPKSLGAPAPSVVTLTPYVSDAFHERGLYFASHGLPFVVVDVRGRGNSAGVFRASIQEVTDAADVIEWLARQSFCNGKVGMWGGSYAASNQWAAAKELPSHLATIVPAAAPYRGVDSPMRNNIFYAERVRWITYTSGRTAQSKIFADDGFWAAKFSEWHRSGQPFRTLDSMVGNPSPAFQEWLDHPEPDAYWDSYNPTADEYARLAIPILTITGIYDDNQSGALEHYSQHLRNTSPAGRERHYLLIGPWDHAGTRTPSTHFGGLTVGTASLLDLNALHLQWYTWAMRGGDKPEFLQKSVTYYVMGCDEWRYADTLEQVTARHEAYYLDSRCNANDVFSSGMLGSVPGAGDPDSYAYDPRDVDGLEVTAECRSDPKSLVDQNVTLALRGKQLVYHSAPLQEDLTVTGFFKLTVWIAIDCPDTDLFVSVHEIALDGSSIRLSTDGVRARYRNGLRLPELIQTPEPLRYDFTRFTFVSRRIRRGHRLRLVIAPMGRLVEATFAQRNYNSGGVVAEESIADARAVTVRLFHDRQRSSVLYVPLDHEACAGEGNGVNGQAGR